MKELTHLIHEYCLLSQDLKKRMNVSRECHIQFNIIILGGYYLVSRVSPSYIKERERVWRMNLHPLVPRSSIRTTNEIAASSHVT